MIDCQSDLLNDLNTRFVVPLLPVDDALRPAARLNPTFDVASEPHVMATHFAAAIPASELKSRTMSLSEHSLTIGNALDMLITGF